MSLNFSGLVLRNCKSRNSPRCSEKGSEVRKWWSFFAFCQVDRHSYWSSYQISTKLSQSLDLAMATGHIETLSKLSRFIVDRTGTSFSSSVGTLHLFRWTFFFPVISVLWDVRIWYFLKNRWLLRFSFRFLRFPNAIVLSLGVGGTTSGSSSSSSSTLHCLHLRFFNFSDRRPAVFLASRKTSDGSSLTDLQTSVNRFSLQMGNTINYVIFRRLFFDPWILLSTKLFFFLQISLSSWKCPNWIPLDRML